MKTFILTICSLFSLTFLFAAPATPTLPNTSAAINQHHLTSYTPDSTYISVEDDSRWKIFPTDGRIFNWSPIDELRIEPNANPTAKDEIAYVFKILNVTKNDSIIANVYRPANYSNPITYVIRSIDRKEGTIQIDHLMPPYNRSSWKVAEADIQKIEKWNIDDTILVGDPSAEATPKTESIAIKTGEKAILINLQSNAFVNVEYLN